MWKPQTSKQFQKYKLTFCLEKRRFYHQDSFLMSIELRDWCHCGMSQHNITHSHHSHQIVQVHALLSLRLTQHIVRYFLINVPPHSGQHLKQWKRALLPKPLLLFCFVRGAGIMTVIDNNFPMRVQGMGKLLPMTVMTLFVCSSPDLQPGSC